MNYYMISCFPEMRLEDSSWEYEEGPREMSEEELDESDELESSRSERVALDMDFFFA